MKTYIIHHSRDLDGWSGGAIAKMKYPDGIFVPYDYGVSLDEIHNIDDGSRVFMIDISLEMTDMLDLSTRSKEFIWIDHHKSAINKYNEFEYKNRLTESSTEIIINTSYAATELTWIYLYTDDAMPEAIHLLGRYDVWDQSNQSKWENEILPFQFGMRLICNSADTFPMQLLSAPSNKHIEHIIDNGVTTLKYKANSDEVACRDAFELEFEGYQAIAMNGTSFNSQAFESIWDESKYDIMMSFRYKGKFWTVSIYTSKEDIDCSEIAKRNDGGGHATAAGFQASTKDMIRLGLI